MTMKIINFRKIQVQIKFFMNKPINRMRKNYFYYLNNSLCNYSMEVKYKLIKNNYNNNNKYRK